MKPLIYYGNISTHGAPVPSTRPFSSTTSSVITFTGFDLSSLAPGMSNKLDLLFYNRVNNIGEVLSSLVYISDPLDLEDVTDKTYDMKKLYVNTDTEKSMQINSKKVDFTYLNCKWATSKFFTYSISPLVDTEHEELPINGDPSVKLNKFGIAFDGWYTQMSVAYRTISSGSPATSPVLQGLFGVHSFTGLGTAPSVLKISNPVNIDDDAIWNQYTTAIEDGTTNPDGSILLPGTSLASLIINLSVDNPYIKQDLFILPIYNSLYDNAVIQYAEYATYGNPFPTLRDKHRIIDDYAADNNFMEAQYILQTTDYFRAVITPQ